MSNGGIGRCWELRVLAHSYGQMLDDQRNIGECPQPPSHVSHELLTSLLSL